MPGKKKAAPEGAPDWMVTYGDMMTLLLCFFVIMLSMSEMKQDQKFQEVMESIRSAFGYDASLGKVPLDLQTRNSLVEQMKKLIAKAAATVKGHNTMINIRGHATREPLPSESRYADAMSLSIARAQAVAEALEENGVRPVRIRITGTGAHEPLVTQAYTEERRALNRRVEIIVTEAVVDDFAGRPATGETE